MTIPVVPRIEMPPRMPRRGFQVLGASRAPSGTITSMTRSPARPCVSATSAIAVRIISRGTGLIAGSPGGSGRPGLVMRPTPSPARKVTPLPAAPWLTRALIKAPCVTSGSSPASFTTPASAQSCPLVWQARAKAGLAPCGKVTVTGSGKLPDTSAL